MHRFNHRKDSGATIGKSGGTPCSLRNYVDSMSEQTKPASLKPSILLSDIVKQTITLQDHHTEESSDTGLRNKVT